MKSLAILLLTLSAATLILAPACADCSHYTADLDVKEEKNNVCIRFNVASSRASTADEEKISSVSIYVFDSNGTLESSELNLSPADDAVSIEASPGKKTIYAISGRQLISPSPDMNLADFETAPFDYSPADIKSDDTFAMIGSSSVTVGKSDSDASGSNCEIIMTRLAAKVQVVFDTVPQTFKDSRNAIGIKTLTKAQFSVMQACSKMRIRSDGSDIFDFTTASNTDGSYVGYENSSAFTSAPAAASPMTQVQYLTENIVVNPTSGNTSFVALKLQAIPTKATIYEKNSGSFTEADFTDALTFYTVGVYDKTSGEADYAIRKKKIMYFNSKDEARNYINAIKKGNKTLTLTSGVADPSVVPQLFEFTDGWVYYRINIEDTDAYGNKRHQVVRNKFYTLNINSINKVGVPSLAHLFPSDPTTPFSSYQESSSQ